MLGRLDQAQQDEQATRVAAAIQAGADGSVELERELESPPSEPRKGCGRARRALAQPRGRGAGLGTRPGRGDPRRGREPPGPPLTRDRAGEVREAAITALATLGPDAVRPALPYLRRRLRSKDVTERVSAMRSLGEAGDTEALAAIEERADRAESADERHEAAAAAAILRAMGA